MSPLVSVIMPARNVERFIDPAITSVRQQSLSALELIVIDDGSLDRTARIVHEHASADERVQLLNGQGRGPGAARNLGLAKARGRWIAVVDADDTILPDRLSTLVGAGADGVQMVADNLIAFYDDGRPDHVWLDGQAWNLDHFISLEAFLLAGIDGTAADQAGYLKPIFDRLWLEGHGLCYDETLSIGEDYDLVARALAKGAAYRFLPEAGYRYRRHTGSTSHRMTIEQLDAMVAGFERMRSGIGPRETQALDLRIDGLLQDRRFVGIVRGLKAGSLAALWEAIRHPRLRRRLLRAASDGLARRLAGR